MPIIVFNFAYYNRKMLAGGTTYVIDLLCGFKEWWRYNVYIIAVGYDREGNRVSFNDLTDRVRDIDSGFVSENNPKDTLEQRHISLTIDPCAYVEIYLYAVPNAFPNSTAIKESPPFTVAMIIKANGAEVERTEFEVNQWGGLTVVAHRVDAGT